jgi:hypothetical protein
LNHLIVAADGYIDPKDGPGDEGTLKLGSCGHGGISLREITFA